MSEISKDIYLMCEDTVVMIFNFDTGKFEVKNHTLLPWGLRGQVKFVPELHNIKTESDMLQRNQAYTNNVQVMNKWLSDRVLSLSRKNAKLIQGLLHLEQAQSVEERADISKFCHSVSLLDNYWTKDSDEDISWRDVNLRHVHLNDLIAHAALHGESVTLTGSLSTPELTTYGVYAKAWRRYTDGFLWLHKAGAASSSEAIMEVMCSHLLDKLSVSHVYYRLTYDNGLTVCACPCITSDYLSIVDFYAIGSYCKNKKIPRNPYIESVDPVNTAKMKVVDYLIANSDRNSHNGGFYVNPKNNELLKLHPLFDHNNAFNHGVLNKRDSLYFYNYLSLQDTAYDAANIANVHIEFPVLRGDFTSEKYYTEFMYRAQELNLQFKENPVWYSYRQLCGYSTIEESATEFERLHDLFCLIDSSMFYDCVTAYMNDGITAINKFMKTNNIAPTRFYECINILSNKLPNDVAVKEKLTNNFVRALKVLQSYN